MVWFDLLILGIIFISVLVSVFRGFFREALSLAAWLLAIFGAIRLGPVVAPHVLSMVDSDTVAVLIAFVVSFLFLLILFSVLNMFIVRLWPNGLKGVDKTLGAIFGLMRGSLLVAVVIMVAELTSLPQAVWWQKSALVPYAQYVSNQIRAWIPELNHQNSDQYPTIGGLSE